MRPSAIRNSFQTAARFYDRSDGIQPDAARRLAAWLPARLSDSAKIMEIGCGTGCFTELLREMYPRNPLWAMDMAPAMVAEARRKVESRQGTKAETFWLSEDARSFEPEIKFDLIASNSVLHWLRPLPETVRRLAGWLSSGGQMVCSLMTEGTLLELHEARRAVAPVKAGARHTLPERQAVLAAVRNAGLAVEAEEMEVKVRMSSSEELLRMLGGQGIAAGFYDSSALLNRTELVQLMREYDNAYAVPGGGVSVTWRILCFRAMKT